MKNKKLWKIFITGTVGMVIGGGITGLLITKVIEQNNKNADKLAKYYHLFNVWLSIKQNNQTLYSYFEKNGYHTVAIYGMKEFGERLLDELKNTDIEVKCIIDKAQVKVDEDIPIYKPEEKLPEVDVIVVTASYYFSEISKNLRDKVKCDIVSIDDLVYNTLKV